MQAPPPRIFDLVLLNHEYDLAELRVDELAPFVHAHVFVQPTFRFNSDIPHARPPFPAALRARPAVFHMEVDLPVSMVARTCETWCRESFARNELGRAFVRFGGRDVDYAVVSDADEIPRREVFEALLSKHGSAASIALTRAHSGSGAHAGGLHLPQLLRWRTAQRNESRQRLLALTSIHHFKYTLRCEERPPYAQWTLGPKLLVGRLLRAIGSQAARDIRSPFCVAVGYHASCSRGLDGSGRPAATLQNASWHLSSMSGGVVGHAYKMEANSDRVLHRHDLSTLREVRRREANCLDHLDRPRAFRATGWNASRLVPTYPDVPRHMSVEKMPWLLGWS